MSGDDNFLARWSRLKQQAAEDERKPRSASSIEAEDRRAAGEAGQPAEARIGAGRAPDKPAEPEPAFDPATLPPIESIVAGTDIRAFLQKGVPAALTKAALRRAWSIDPAIRDFIEVAENQWDYANPASIPGFGPLQATDNVRQLVEQALGNLPEALDAPTADPPQTSAGAAASQGAAGNAPPAEAPAEESMVHMQVTALRKTPDNPDTPGVAALQQHGPEPQSGKGPRRKGHGRAMPR